MNPLSYFVDYMESIYMREMDLKIKINYEILFLLVLLIVFRLVFLFFQIEMLNMNLEMC